MSMELGKEVKRGTDELKASDSAAFIAFLPLGALGVHFLYKSIPLAWALLAGVLKAMCLISFFSNLMTNDVLWSVFGLCAFVLVSLPVYFNTLNGRSKENITCMQGNHSDKVVFSEVFETCRNQVFSDYRISLLSKIPLAIQVLAAGTVFYSVFGLDWILHSLAGFGIGAVSVKAYKAAVSTYGYNKLASYFDLDRFRFFKNEGKWASAEWTLFCLVVVTVSFELMERAVHFMSPSNMLRIGLEVPWNSAGDAIFGIFGGMAAWYLIERRLHWV
jgi:hypothetical protein